MRRLGRMIRRVLTHPGLIIVVILSLGLLGVLLAFGNAPTVVAKMEEFPHLYLLWYLLVMIGYEAFRGFQWHVLLRSEGIRAPVRTQALAYLMSEVVKTLPVGNYFENYVLERVEGTNFGLSSAATTMSVLVEVAVSLAAVVILGLGSWTSWLRPVVGIGSGVALIVAIAVVWLRRNASAPVWMTRRRMLRRVLAELRQFRTGAFALLRPLPLLAALVIGAIYLAIAGSGMYIIARGVGVDVTLWQAWAVYTFSLAFSLIFPLPVDLGVLEVSGVGAWLVLGVGRPEAVSIMLINRVISLGAAIVIAAVGIIFLRRELREAMSARPRKQPEHANQPTAV